MASIQVPGMMLATPLYVALGGAIGALLRYGVGLMVPGTDGHSFPWSTFAVNVLGCLMIGILWRFTEGNQKVLIPLLMVGLLGGFTTFSSFGLDAWRLIEGGHLILALTYILSSTMVGVLAVVIGVKLIH